MKISILGCGYVGLVTGACFAEMGNNVICADNNIEKINSLKNNKMPIYEQGLNSIIVRAIKNIIVSIISRKNKEYLLHKTELSGIVASVFNRPSNYRSFDLK